MQFSSDIYYCSEAEGNVRVEAGTFQNESSSSFTWLSSKKGACWTTIFWMQRLVKVVRLGEDEDECSATWPLWTGCPKKLRDMS